MPDYGTFLNQRGDAGIALADNAAPALLEVVGIEIDSATRKRLGLPETPSIGPRLVRGRRASRPRGSELVSRQRAPSA